MKPLFLFTTLFMGLSFFTSNAQAPDKFNYQAVAKNQNGQPITGNIEVQLSILDGNTQVYKEKHNTTANEHGLFNLHIGAGIPLVGSWSAINWGAGAGKKLEVAINGILMGAQELVSVPYAQLSADLALPFSRTVDGGGDDAFKVVNQNGFGVVGLSYNGDGMRGHYAGNGSWAGVSAVTESAHPNSLALWAHNFATGAHANLAVGNYSGVFYGGELRVEGSPGGLIQLGDDSNPYFEMRATDNVGYPFIDLSNDNNSDFDARILLAGDDNLTIEGAKLGIGVSPVYSLHVKQTAYNSGLALEGVDSGDTWGFATINNGSHDLNLFFNGAFRGYFYSGNGNYVPASDMRLKKEILPVEMVMPELMKMEPVTYRFNHQTEDKRRSYGFLAQEVEKVFPELVHVCDNGELEGTYSLDYTGMGVIAIKAIQEQQKLIETLIQRIEALEQKVQELENK